MSRLSGKNASVLFKVCCHAFIVSATCFDKKVFSYENNPDLLRGKLQYCEAEITRGEEAILNSSLYCHVAAELCICEI